MQGHWDDTYNRKATDDVSWFEATPDNSLRLAQSCELSKGSKVIDVGGGSSLFGASMLKEGMEVTVLDISNVALEKGRARAGDSGAKIRWVSANVLDLECPDEAAAKFDLWHDRAAFHFLTTTIEQQQYVKRLLCCVKPAGWVLIATFSTDGGPKRCSGLEVKPWNASLLQQLFGDSLKLVRSEIVKHETPWGSDQKFCYCLFQKNTLE